MEPLSGFIKKLADALTKKGLDYAFTGALAASYYGVPRTTADIDVLVSACRKDTKNKLASALRSVGLQVEEKKIDDALTSGYNIATFTCKDAPYRVDIILTEQIQKRRGTIADIDTFVQAPEELITAKLRMIKATLEPERTLKDEEDVKAIIIFTQVDRASIAKQATREGTLEIWKRLLSD